MCAYIERGLTCRNAPMDGSSMCGCRTINYAAVRAFNRIAAPITAEATAAADADAGFDGGEWSRGWHDRRHHAAMLRLCVRVARRFGMSADDLWTDVISAGHENVDHFMESRQ